MTREEKEQARVKALKDYKKGVITGDEVITKLEELGFDPENTFSWIIPGE